MIDLLLAAAGCVNSPGALLDANHQAMGPRPTRGTEIARYSYTGQGLTGSTSFVVDLATGRFLDTTNSPPITDLHGFDGRSAWYRDLSGAFVPQETGGRRALAVSEAYVNANGWWKKDGDGARIEPTGCNTLKVTPRGGNPFEARFDGATGLLLSIRQTLTFGVSTETRFSDYRRRSGLVVPTRIEIVTEDDPSTLETMSLVSLRIEAPSANNRFKMPTSHPAGWSLPPSGKVQLPFRLLNNHVIVDTRVDGKGPFPFLLDSGGHNIVTPATLTALGLAARGESTSGGGGEALATNGYAHVDRLDVGGAVLTGQTVVTLDFSPVAVEGLQLGGMIGQEFLERFVVRIDYGRRTLTIMDRKKFGRAEREASGTAVPFTFYEHMPQVAGTFDGRPARFNIDTGSRSDVTMTSPFVERHGLRAAYSGIQAVEGWGVGGPTRAVLVRAGSMTLGPVEVPGPIAGLSTARKGALSDRNYDGNVGSGALKRFTVTFDYGARTLYLKPAARLDADTGHFDRSGMWLNLADGGLEVMDVASGGPAAAAGLKPGDLITAIFGHEATERPLSDIRSALKTAAPGQPLVVQYLRARRPGTATLIPRTLIPDAAP
jgi:hypothetical protein